MRDLVKFDSKLFGAKDGTQIPFEAPDLIALDIRYSAMPKSIKQKNIVTRAKGVITAEYLVHIYKLEGSDNWLCFKPPKGESQLIIADNIVDMYLYQVTIRSNGHSCVGVKPIIKRFRKKV